MMLTNEDHERPVSASAQQTEPIYLSTVLFTKAENAILCQDLLESGAVMTLAGVGPSGKPVSCTGAVKSINRHSLLHPEYPVMITIVEKFPDQRSMPGRR